MIYFSAPGPEIFHAVAICALLLVDVYLRDDQRGITYLLAMATLAGTAVVSAYFSVYRTVCTFFCSFVADPASGALKMLAYLIVALVFLYSRDHLKNSGLF